MLPEDRLLQDEPVVFNVWDYDQVTAHNIIGRVYIDLSCLCKAPPPTEYKELTSDLKQSKERTYLEMGASSIKGWFPIYDTMRGHCGEIRIKASIDFFGDTNPFKDSSAGILFFSATHLPEPFPKAELLGFVEELVYEDDPEEDWADYMRSKRKSNNQRQHLFTVLSGQVRRHLGRKTMELDGNAVLGYNLEIDFDKYGRKVIARGYGTAALVYDCASDVVRKDVRKRSLDDRHLLYDESTGTIPTPLGSAIRAASFTQSFTEASASITSPGGGGPIARSITDPSEGGNMRSPGVASLPLSRSNSFPDLPLDRGWKSSGGVLEEEDVREKGEKAVVQQAQSVQVFTMKAFPKGVRLEIGGAVSVHAVKLMPAKRTQATWDQWWSDVRDEVKTNANSLGCTHVAGYAEHACVMSDIVILSAFGTAANYEEEGNPQAGVRPFKEAATGSPCEVCHVPYSMQSTPFASHMVRCGVCMRGYVPETLFATIEAPPDLPVAGDAVLVEARVARKKLDKEGEKNAALVSDMIPFITYDLHRQLSYKMKMHGLNAIFGLRTQLVVAEELIVATATATGLYVTALPPPSSLSIRRNIIHGKNNMEIQRDRVMIEVQHRIEELSRIACKRHMEMAQSLLADHTEERSGSLMTGRRHREDPLNKIDPFVLESDESEDGFHEPGFPDLEEDDEEEGQVPREKTRMLDLREGESREVSVVEVEDLELDDDMDEDLLASLLDPQMPRGCEKVSFVAGEIIPIGCGATLSKQPGELVSVLQRVKFDKSPHHCDQRFSSIFNNILRTMAYKFRGEDPYFVMGLHTTVTLPADDEVEVCLTGIAHRGIMLPASEEDAYDASGLDSPSSSQDPSASPRQGGSEPVGSSVQQEEHEAEYQEGRVDITPLSSMPGMVVVKYLGPVQSMMIKETENATRSAVGFGGAAHSALLEAHSLLRANVAARGGNALLSFRMQECSIKQDRSDMYCVLLMSGDAALVQPTGMQDAGLLSPTSRSGRRKSSQSSPHVAQDLRAPGTPPSPQDAQGSWIPTTALASGVNLTLNADGAVHVASAAGGVDRGVDSPAGLGQGLPDPSVSPRDAGAGVG